MRRRPNWVHRRSPPPRRARLDVAFVYNPKKNFVGAEHFSYRVSDGKLLSAKATTVTLTVR